MAGMGSFDSMNFIDIIFLLTCGYVFVCGIVGKGKIYDDSTIHPTRRDDYIKAIRIFSLVGGAIGMASIIFGMLGFRVAAIVLGAVFFAAIIALVIVIWPMNKDRVNQMGTKDKRNRKG